jgi:hypothetical protein
VDGVPEGLVLVEAKGWGNVAVGTLSSDEIAFVVAWAGDIGARAPDVQARPHPGEGRLVRQRHLLEGLGCLVAVVG